MDLARRKNLLESTDTLVVKVGSRVLSDANRCLDVAQVGALAKQLSELVSLGKRVVLVSSGAVAAGIGKLGLRERPADLARLQAVASVGQAQLIQTYEQFFTSFGHHAAQILLIADDLDDRQRYLNVRNTLLALLEMRVIPIINENDSVAVDELLTTFGDNDRLAAMVAGLFDRPALIILSDVEGLYDRDPSDPSAKIINLVDRVEQATFDLAAVSSKSISKGGMASKLKAAQFASRSGSPVLIACGRTQNILPRLVAGEELGTLFLPQSRGLVPKKRWIGFTAQTAGTLQIDTGAVKALRASGKSLLAIGIVDVQGQFEKGDIVSICDEHKTEIARGLTNYNESDLQRIKGLRSPSIHEVLGHCPYDEVIHRDNMALVDD